MSGLRLQWLTLCLATAGCITTWRAQPVFGLRAVGFDVKTAGDPLGPEGVEVEGTLHSLFVEPVIGFSTISYEADIHVKLRVTSESGLVAERSFFVKSADGGAVAMTSVGQGVLDRSTEKIVTEMVAAILSLMNRYPQLGEAPRQGSQILLSIALESVG